MKTKTNNNPTSPLNLVSKLTKEAKAINDQIAKLGNTSADKIVKPILEKELDKIQSQILNLSSSVLIDKTISKIAQGIKDVLKDNLELVSSEAYTKDSISYVVTFNPSLDNGFLVSHSARTTRKASSRTKSKIEVNGVAYSSFNKAIVELSKTMDITYKGEVIKSSTWTGEGVNGRLVLERNNIEYVEIKEESKTKTKA